MKNWLIIDEFGNDRYYLDGRLHREDGPAIEFSNGDKHWYINDLFHREDGPAIEYPNGDKFWYIGGQEIHCKDNEEFLRIVNLIEFM
jgi:hypothetical protein